jgi:hypothetical protein
MGESSTKGDRQNMKLQINYEHNQDAELPCCAVAEVNGSRVYCVGATWERAKERLLSKARAMTQVGAPPQSEDVEL